MQHLVDPKCDTGKQKLYSSFHMLRIDPKSTCIFTVAFLMASFTSLFLRR